MLALQRCGGIAQLGERLHGMQEVSGSIPLTSTNSEVWQWFCLSCNVRLFSQQQSSKAVMQYRLFMVPIV
jgi:hypothetical protein